MSAPSPSADCNLLFGILALQVNFLTRDALIQGMNAWVLEKHRALGDILVEQGTLLPHRRDMLEAMVAEHLKVHDNDAQKSLAALSSVGSARNDLARIADPDVQASVGHIGSTPGGEADSWATQAPVPPPSDRTVRFKRLRSHARGGLGEVFVALDEELQREVALKEIQNQHADNSDSRARFLLEAEVTGKLEHPGVVPVYGLGSYPDGRPFYAMRFIRGDSLKDAIERFHMRVLSAEPGLRAVELRGLLGRFLDVCDAVAYAHSRGVLHRDLKPGNVMLGRYGETLVVDWGLAKLLGRKDEIANEDAPLTAASASGGTPTQAGKAIGTPQFMSPEQAAGRLEQLGPATDVYSLGATLYCLLTGQPPFPAPAEEGLGALLHKVEQGDFRSPRQVKSDVPRPLEAICLKAMARQLEGRYHGAGELAEDVKRWLADEPVSAYREPAVARLRRWSRRHRSWALAGGVALLVVLAVTLVSGVLVFESWNAQHKQRKRADDIAAHLDQTSADLEQQLGLSLRIALDKVEEAKRLNLGHAGRVASKRKEIALLREQLKHQIDVQKGLEMDFMAGAKVSIGTMMMRQREKLGPLAELYNTQILLADQESEVPNLKLLVAEAQTSLVRIQLEQIRTSPEEEGTGPDGTPIDQRVKEESIRRKLMNLRIEEAMVAVIRHKMQILHTSDYLLALMPEEQRSAATADALARSLKAGARDSTMTDVLLAQALNKDIKGRQVSINAKLQDLLRQDHLWVAVRLAIADFDTGSHRLMELKHQPGRKEDSEEPLSNNSMRDLGQKAIWDDFLALLEGSDERATAADAMKRLMDSSKQSLLGLLMAFFREAKPLTAEEAKTWRAMERTIRRQHGDIGVVWAQLSPSARRSLLAATRPLPGTAKGMSKMPEKAKLGAPLSAMETKWLREMTDAEKDADEKKKIEDDFKKDSRAGRKATYEVFKKTKTANSIPGPKKLEN